MVTNTDLKQRLDELADIARKQNKIQSAISDKQSELNKLATKRLALDEERTELNRKILLQQEIQNKRQERQELHVEAQRQLKKVLFCFKQEITDALSMKSNVAKYVLLERADKSIADSGITPQDFDELADKEDASSTFRNLRESKLALGRDFAASDINDIEIIRNGPDKLRESRQKVESLIGRKRNIEANISRNARSVGLTCESMASCEAKIEQLRIQGFPASTWPKVIYPLNIWSRYLAFRKHYLQNRIVSQQASLEEAQKEETLVADELAAEARNQDACITMLDDVARRHPEIAFLLTV